MKLNFFFMGPGSSDSGRRSAPAIALTDVELDAPSLYPIMFGTVFVMNTVFALVGWREAKALSEAMR